MSNSIIVRVLIIILGTLSANHIYAFKEPESYEIPSSFTIYHSAHKNIPYHKSENKIHNWIWKFELPYHFAEESFTKIRYGVDFGVGMQKIDIYGNGSEREEPVYGILGGYVRFILPVTKSFYVTSNIGLQGCFFNWQLQNMIAPLIFNGGLIYYPIKWIGLEFAIGTELMRYDYYDTEQEVITIKNDKLVVGWDEIIKPRAYWGLGIHILF